MARAQIEIARERAEARTAEGVRGPRDRRPGTYAKVGARSDVWQLCIGPRDSQGGQCRRSLRMDDVQDVGSPTAIRASRTQNELLLQGHGPR
eukprot:scaffold2723_cov108-Isochrysis_galbana.AAC.1